MVVIVVAVAIGAAVLVVKAVVVMREVVVAVMAVVVVMVLVLQCMCWLTVNDWSLKRLSGFFCHKLLLLAALSPTWSD